MAYHQNYHHGHEQYEYAPAPEATFVVPPPPQSAFSPGYHNDPYAGPRSSTGMLGTAVVVEATPMMDHAGLSRSSSRARPEYEVANGRRYLAVGGYNKSNLGRSNSERGRESRERGQIVVESSRHGHSRSRSDQKAYHYEVAQRDHRKKYYHDDDNYSTYSGTSSYGHNDSRGHSRSASRHRPRQAHSRSSSRGSSDFHDDRYSVEPYLKPSRAEEELVEKLKDVQLKLDKVQQMTEKRRLEESKKNSEKAMNEEIERKVQEQIKKQKQADEDAARKQKEALEAERQRIAEAAKKLLEEQAAAMKKKQEAEEAEKKRLQEIIEAERAKYQAASMGKKTYTRFSKTHLCKEALEERSIPFTEEPDYFLVHRFVEKPEQQYLWSRTKEIRNYYRQIQEAAEKAPAVPGPNGGYVKYVQIAGQPYPIALPVTIVQNPGGAQTQRVDPAKIRWTDIFKAK